ncbi:MULTISPECIES: SMC-Scp complex subunit ScpB [Clostridium]|uniref:Segregation and condensation protein B n=2 Tax=Clostridium TaxID=1485 RepID=A0A151AQE5_9CLOT|nr:MULTISPECIES: SMC-Scp complex subunit ScpB [Clostridium]MBE6078992.1 segregation/condensation protein B [Clostridium lundense]KYH29835.1 segregation and condensation protein B [Clostridium colicanis DSM 13634]MBE6042707.1 segregation/condensation protein B [Clostridium thermopalmarium]PRR75216.1 Segregation and condensation protein B [Clostridium thermopalmarium DSM 5974]PVZ27972.1 segregation and condensation protein B [Clostridium thermopalmarium DSM 5974]
MKSRSVDQLEMNEVSMKKRYFSIIESILFVSGEAMNIKEIADILECDIEYTYKLLQELKKEYEKEERGILLINMNDEYTLVTKSENSSFVQKLLKTNSRQSLSRAALETLAIIVYRQPITRVEIDEIRGVKSDKAIQTLLERNLIKESGRKHVLGRPIMYGTTDEFLRYFGLQNLEQMPSLNEFIQDSEEEG